MADEKDSKLGRGFMGVQELARRWNVSDATIKRLITEGELSGIKVRQSYKIKMESVEDYEQRTAFNDIKSV